MSAVDAHELILAGPERARQLVTPPVLYMPIRHHSPACAMHVQDVIREHQPAVVLVEGPPLFNDQIDFLLDPQAKLPLAIYSHAALDVEGGADGQNRVGAYFPLCDYSPEFVALRVGREVGASLGFVDLDYVERAATSDSIAGHTDERMMLFSRVLDRANTKNCARLHRRFVSYTSPVRCL